ncbi:hypothetical protein NPIL_435101 [Nephila pilipes]|uniref:Uncharacterized protein n=1 Tax=Nephila pilipes TaxID=299642 RepID=A0A8X6QRY1_NEPPI|nr:hypothetical protein NPIL_435101 [Nephila pilipes]
MQVTSGKALYNSVHVFAQTPHLCKFNWVFTPPTVSIFKNGIVKPDIFIKSFLAATKHLTMWTVKFCIHVFRPQHRRPPSTMMHFPRRSGVVASIRRRVSCCRDISFPHEPNFSPRSKRRIAYEIAHYVVPTRGGSRIDLSSCAGHIMGNEREHLNNSSNACKRSR